MIAEVIVDIAASETDRIYDYLCDEDTIVGSRVRGLVERVGDLGMRKYLHKGNGRHR